MGPTETDIIPVTVVIPVKNEAVGLLQCLESVSSMADVVVADSSSHDGTAEVARQWGATVVNFMWNGGFPKKRNWVLQNYPFRTEWVLFLDADEVLTDDFIRELRLAVVATEYVGYWIRYSNYFQGRLLRFGVPQQKLALFRIGSGSYEQIEDPGWSDLDMEVHEHPILQGRVGKLHSGPRHYDYKSLYKFIERHNKYSTWEANRYVASSLKTTASGKHGTFRQRAKYALADKSWLSFVYFIYSYFVKCGFLDGRAGLHYAIYKAIYFFEISEKIRELRRMHSERSSTA